MQATGNNNARLTLRISPRSLAFSAVDRTAEQQVVYEPYDVKPGISMAANLRQALEECSLPQQGYTRLRLYLDAPVLTVPAEEFHEEDAEALYRHTFTGHNSDAILFRPQPSLGMVAVFPVNRDLKAVVEDRFEEVRFTPVMQTVWNYLHQRSLVGLRSKLYCYFRDRKMDVFAFQKNRLKFSNSFDVQHAKDALYFLLYVWKQLGMDQQQDELHIIGEVPEREWFLHSIRLYIRKTVVLNPTAEFNRAPLTTIPHLPFDLMTLYLGR